jgi:hypothetical protein
MGKKNEESSSGMMLTLLLTSMLMLAFNVRVAIAPFLDPEPII